MTRQLTPTNIRELIDMSDPALLFEHGAPDDEYIGEAHAVCEYLRKNPELSQEQLTKALKEIFASRFSPKTVEINPGAYDKLAHDIQEFLNQG
jgi:hypothetical protein